MNKSSSSEFSERVIPPVQISQRGSGNFKPFEKLCHVFVVCFVIKFTDNKKSAKFNHSRAYS